MEESDSQPLLAFDETGDWSSVSPTQKLFKRQRIPHKFNDGKDVLANLLSVNEISVNQDESMVELEHTVDHNIVSIFVVAFDTHSGNIVEWCLPKDTDLDSVEFKAMPSGAHTVTSDFLYFRKGNLYGLSCFKKLEVDSLEERGARMKSVGVLTNSYTTLYKHLSFLELQVQHQLETPGDYQQLIAFYEDKRGLLPTTSNVDESCALSAAILSHDSRCSQFPEMTITHPAGCFLHFVRFFGEKIFALWRLALLQRRILLFSPPPIGVVCYRVYCTSCLGRHNFKKHMKHNIKPYFYVNIADIEYLENEMSYVACTTERIFAEKQQLYDVYVDNRVMKSSIPTLKDVIKVNRSDEEKYQQLLNHRQEHVYLERIGEPEHANEEQMFISFFMERNNRIFQTLMDVSNSDDRTLTSEHMRVMGLDPVADRQFIIMMLEVYNVDLLMVVDNPCCPV